MVQRMVNGMFLIIALSDYGIGHGTGRKYLQLLERKW